MPPAKSKSRPKARKKRPLCPNCDSRKVIRKGVRKGKHREVQLYFCTECKKGFTPETVKGVKWPPRVILKAVTLYNLGHTQQEISSILAKRHRAKVPQRTISMWIRRHRDSCPFTRLRSKALKICKPGGMLFTSRLEHKQVYKYQVHRAKLALLGNEIPKRVYSRLCKYLARPASPGFPHHIFQEFPQGKRAGKARKGSRASQARMSMLEFTRLGKTNTANQLAALALPLARANKDRHEAVQGFMLANDSVTVAAEVPVYLTQRDLGYFLGKGFWLDPSAKTPVTGHIDLLQIRNGMVHILDYKPGARKVDAVSQLVTYALALASRTQLQVKDFKCAWFDDRDYFEFFPLHAVYQKRP